MRVRISRAWTRSEVHSYLVPFSLPAKRLAFSGRCRVLKRMKSGLIRFRASADSTACSREALRPPSPAGEYSESDAAFLRLKSLLWGLFADALAHHGENRIGSGFHPDVDAVQPGGCDFLQCRLAHARRTFGTGIAGDSLSPGEI